MIRTVFLLSAAVQNKGEGYELAEMDAGGILLGEWRLEACKQLISKNPELNVVIVGWHDELDPTVSRATVMHDLLIGHYDVDPARLETITQEEDGTQGNMKAIARYLSEGKVGPEECALLTNFYHLPRVMRLLAEQGGLLITPIAAESLLVHRQEEIRVAYSSEAFSGRLMNELNSLGPTESDLVR
jgi:hypothetical protein